MATRKEQPSNLLPIDRGRVGAGADRSLLYPASSIQYLFIER